MNATQPSGHVKILIRFSNTFNKSLYRYYFLHNVKVVTVLVKETGFLSGHMIFSIHNNVCPVTCAPWHSLDSIITVMHLDVLINICS